MSAVASKASSVVGTSKATGGGGTESTLRQKLEARLAAARSSSSIPRSTEYSVEQSDAYYTGSKARNGTTVYSSEVREMLLARLVEEEKEESLKAALERRKVGVGIEKALRERLAKGAMG